MYISSVTTVMAMILSTKYLHRMCELLADRLWFFRILLVWVFNYWIFPLAQNNNHLIIPAFVIKQIHNFVWKSGKHKHISVNTLYEQQAIVFGLLFIVSRATPYNSNNRTAICHLSLLSLLPLSTSLSSSWKSYRPKKMY